jgi:outer membrane protein TolC
LVGVPARSQPAASPPAAPTAASQATSVTVTLREALDAAWQRAVSARESDGQRRRAEAERRTAGRVWASAPTLELSHRAERLLGSGGGREIEVGIAVPLWLPGQQAAFTHAADRAVELAQAAGQAARLRLAGEVREAAWQVAAMQAEAKQADAQATALRQLADDVERRVQAGDLARADSLAAQAEQLAAAAAVADTRQRLQAAKSRWTLLTGLAASPDMSAGTATDTAADMGRHPEWHLARQATELARKRVDLMRHSRRDAPELSLGVRQDAPGRGQSSQGSLVVGLRLPFGTDDRNRPIEAAALADLDIAQTQEQRLRERLDSDLAAARDAERSAQVQLDAETTRARLLRERAVLIDKSFRAGETPLPDLLRALAAAAQADNAVARQTAALGLASARRQQALGLLP